MCFKQNGDLYFIEGTKFDFEGKALYIENLIKEQHLNPNDILFIGNDINDEHVYKTGCNTLCINPETKNFDNTEVWNNCYSIDNSLDLIQIIDSVFNNNAIYEHTNINEG